MKNADVDSALLRQVVADLGPMFRPTDVSTDTRVVGGHPHVTAGELNTTVGRVLSKLRTEFGIELVDDRPSATWRRSGGYDRSPPAARPTESQ